MAKKRPTNNPNDPDSNKSTGGRRALPKLDPLMEGYLEYMETVERRSKATVKDIRCTLRRVSEEMERLRPGKRLWALKLIDYIRFLGDQQNRGYSQAGLCKNVSHLRGFLNYAWRTGRCDRNVMADYYPEDRCAKKEPDSLTIPEALAMVQKSPSSTAIERRDRVIVMLLYGCGLRTGELCTLKIQDISVERRELHLKKAKGDVERIVPIPEVVFTQLLAYLHERGKKRGPLFVTEAKRRPIKQSVVSDVVKSAAERAGIERRVVPKMLRHSYATHLMDRGVDIAVISKLMGHVGPAESGWSRPSSLSRADHGDVCTRTSGPHWLAIAAARDSSRLSVRFCTVLPSTSQPRLAAAKTKPIASTRKAFMTCLLRLQGPHSPTSSLTAASGRRG